MTLHQVCLVVVHFVQQLIEKSDDSISLEEAINFVDSLSVKQAEYNKAKFPNTMNCTKYGKGHLTKRADPFRRWSTKLMASF